MIPVAWLLDVLTFPLLLFVVLVFGTDRANEAHVIGAARDRGVGLYGMSQHRASGLTRPPQLVLGFGNLTDRAIRSGIADIADLLGASRPRN